MRKQSRTIVAFLVGLIGIAAVASVAFAGNGDRR